MSVRWLPAVAGMLAMASAATAQTISPYPACSPNKPSPAPCQCGIRPARICPAHNWCSYTPEGEPLCSRARLLHR